MELQILNLLPAKIGEEIVDKFKKAHLDVSEANKVLARLIDEGYVVLDKDTLLPTEKATKLLEEKSKSMEIEEIGLMKRVLLQKIIWGAETRQIHPYLDFSEDRAFVGCYMPIREKKEVEIKFIIVTSKKEIFPIEEIQDYGYAAKVNPARIEQRFSLEMINKFLTSKIDFSFKEVFEEIKNLLMSYIDFPDKRFYDLLPLWIIGTYFFPIFNSYPYLYIGGVKQSGKTKLLTFLACLCFNSKFALSLTPSTLFRLVTGTRSSLMIDETEKIVKRDIGDYRSMLLAGYKKGVMVPRSTESLKKKRFYVEEFDVYSPKALANIEGIEDVLEDRTIEIFMERSQNPRIVNKVIDMNAREWQDIRDKLYILLFNHWKEVKSVYSVLSEYMHDNVQNVVSEENIASLDKLKKCVYMQNSDLTCISTLNLMGRDLELWLPIITLACLTNTLPSIVPLAKDLVEKKTIQTKTEVNDAILASVLLAMVDRDDWYPVVDIMKNMKILYEEETPKKEKDWLTPQWIGRALRRLNIISDKRRVSKGVQVYLKKEVVERVGKKLGVEPAEIGFTKVEPPISGKCSYCGQEKELCWKDNKGNYLCQDCYVEEGS
jgi:hypothetical protein